VLCQAPGLGKTKRKSGLSNNQEGEFLHSLFFLLHLYVATNSDRSEKGRRFTPNKSERFQNKLKAPKDALTLKEQSSKKEKNFLLFSLA
jgi:hypothetical protein